MSIRVPCWNVISVSDPRLTPQRSENTARPGPFDLGMLAAVRRLGGAPFVRRGAGRPGGAPVVPAGWGPSPGRADRPAALVTHPRR